jgi:hypothetical protein
MKKPVTKTKISLLQLLEEKVDIAKLIANVPLREEALIDAALEQPSLILNAGKVRVHAFHKRTILETRLKLVQSQAGLRLRRIRDGKGRKEFTEGAVKERIELQPKVQKTRLRLDRALVEEEMGKLLQEVFRQRSDSIRVIVNAGKVSVHAKELELLRSNKKLAKAVARIRDRWQHNDEEEN